MDTDWMKPLIEVVGNNPDFALNLVCDLMGLWFLKVLLKHSQWDVMRQTSQIVVPLLIVACFVWAYAL